MEQKKIPFVGFPRAMLYYRYGKMWEAFFHALGLETTVSSPTSRQTLDQGALLAPDESCLSVKIFMGHVRELIGTCQYILIPRIVSFGRKRSMCVRFASLYDLTRNLFRETNQKFLAYDINVEQGVDEPTAWFVMGKSLGFSLREIQRAYSAAQKVEQSAWKMRIKRQEKRCREKGMKLLLAGHSYVLEDPYIGRPVVACLRSLGATPIRADLVDRGQALKRSAVLSPTCKWELNREILGGIVLRQSYVDGIILVSAFPCGPDALVNDILLRRLNHIPVLNLVLDGQNGTAGVETRLESFLDIIRFKEGLL